MQQKRTGVIYFMTTEERKARLMEIADAEKIKLLEDSPKMDPALKKKVDDAIARNLAVWITGVQLAIEEFDHLETLPGQVLLCGGGAGLSQIPEALATGDWYKSLPFARRPLIHMIDPGDIPGIKNASGVNLDHTLITAMGLLRVGIDTLVGTSATGGLKAKLAKLLRN